MGWKSSLHPALILVDECWLVCSGSPFSLQTRGWAGSLFQSPLLREAGCSEAPVEEGFFLHVERVFFPLPLEGGSCWDGGAAACRPLHIRLKNAGAACAGLCGWVGGAGLSGEVSGMRMACLLLLPP